MVKVTIGTNTTRRKVIVPKTKVLRDLLDENEVNYSVATLHLDGASLGVGDIDKTFSELGIGDACYLIAVVKTENA